ncbi:MAG TPA: zinc-ribbon domain-containing protein [Syntrophomonadaceae bacterium]|nr:zinc-ribbon domain-containing protein [Syntrophomonadaceae bacterium]
MKCNRCDTELPDDSVFCPKCGERNDGAPPLPPDGVKAIEKGGRQPNRLQGAVLIGFLVVAVIFTIFYFIGKDDNSNSKSNIISGKDTTTQSDPAANKSEQTSQPSTATTKNGFDKVTNKDGSYYEGNFVNGKMQGKGTYVYASGTKIVGDFEDNKITGQEVVYYPNGDIYEGHMLSAKRDGKGKYTGKAGGSYDGVWSADKKNGYAVAYYSNNRVTYEGQFVNDVRQDPNGKQTYPDGMILEGNFTNDQFTGQGTAYYSNGIYRGSFINQLKEGYGRYEWESGNYYEGNWKNDKRNGQGSFYHADTGVTDFGTWQDDVWVAAG